MGESAATAQRGDSDFSQLVLHYRWAEGCRTVPPAVGHIYLTRLGVSRQTAARRSWEQQDIFATLPISGQTRSLLGTFWNPHGLPSHLYESSNFSACQIQVQFLASLRTAPVKHSAHKHLPAIQRDLFNELTKLSQKYKWELIF